MNFQYKSRIFILVFLLICVVCFLAYFNSLFNPFIWDDDALVVKNILIRNPQNLLLSFNNDLYFGVKSGSNFYRPLQTISYMLYYHFWQLDPFGYHLTNIFLQAGVSFLILILLVNLSISFPLALSSALFFASSPVQTEAVTYISGRAEMLMGIFAISSLIFFILSRKKTLKYPVLFSVLSVISFILSLLSKEAAIVFPSIICGYIFYLLHDRLKEKYYFLKNIIPFAIITIIYLFLRLSLFNFNTIRPPSLTNIPWFIRLCVLPKIVFTYLKLLILPVGLHMSRQLARPTSIFGILAAVFSLGAIILICLRYLRYPPRNKVASFMLFWSVIFFIPQSGIFPINAFIAEHFIYLSSVGFYLLLAYGLHKFLRPKLFYLVVGLFCAFNILLTCGRNFEWRNPLVFYKNIIKYSPDSFQAHNNLGLQYEYLGRLNEAEFHYKRALEIKPDLIEARFNLANLYFRLKRFKEAEDEYRQLEKSPLGTKAGEVDNNLGNIYEVTGDYQRAIIKYNQALKCDAGLKFTHFNLARIYYSRRDIKSAASCILESLGDLDKTDQSKRKTIADFLKNTCSVNNAAAFYNDLGINLAKNNYWQLAISAFNCALELDPGSSDYHYNLGFAYFSLGEKLKAKDALKQALMINSNHIRAKRLITRINYKN